MKHQYHILTGQHSRRDARARVRGWAASAVASTVGVVVMLDTLFTAKINPCVVSGGLPREGNS